MHFALILVNLFFTIACGLICIVTYGKDEDFTFYVNLMGFIGNFLMLIIEILKML